MSNRTFESIPEFLQGKTIAITGTFPGVGKSYVKNNWVNKLRNAGYKVWNCGTTQKASVDCTVAKKSLTTKEWTVKSNHNKTNAFYFIDEAWMYTQEKLDELKAAYPKCCFVIIGDPLQFEPVEDGTIINKIDFCINLTKQMRAKDDDLFEAIKMLKAGIIPIDFMREHATELTPELLRKSITITYTNSHREGLNKTLSGYSKNVVVRSVTSHRYTDADGNKRVETNNETEWKNGELWEITELEPLYWANLRKLSDDAEIKVDWEDLTTYFSISHAINNHKIQGDTIKNKDLYIIIDDCLTNPKNIQTLLRHLYVAISRAQNSKQIHFDSTIDNIKCLSGKPLENPNQIKCPIFDTDSAYLSKLSIDEIFDLLLKNLLPKMTDFVPYIGNNLSFLENKNNYISGIDNNKNKEYIVQNLLTEVTFENASEKRHFVENLSKQLDERPLQEVPGKGKCFISKNKMILNKASHEQKDLEEYHWFVFENDEMTLEEQEKYFLDRHSKTNVNKYIFRVIYSGNKSLHFWIYVKNAPTNVETYKKMAKKINEVVFGGKMCQSCINPAQLMRAPNVIRPDTGKVQKVIKQTRKVVVFDYSQLEEEPLQNVETKQEVSTGNFDNKVVFAFEMMKNDHDGSDGGRGRLILDKAYREKYTRGWTNEECRQLIELLCRAWNCSDKISRLQKYFE